jgi:transcription elongation factor GreA
VREPSVDEFCPSDLAGSGFDGHLRLNEKLLTPAGFAKLNAELRFLRSKREALVDRVRLSAGQLDARDELVRLDRHIVELEGRLAAATIVRPDPADGEVGIGERARVRDLDSRELIEYRIVGVGEANPATGSISYTSPVGSALLGRRVGDVFEVQVPRGVLRFELLQIEP